MSAPAKSRSLASSFAASKSVLAVPVSDCERGLGLTASFLTVWACAGSDRRRSGVASPAQRSVMTAHALRVPLRKLAIALAPFREWLIPSSPCSVHDSKVGWARAVARRVWAERVARCARVRESALNAPRRMPWEGRSLWVPGRGQRLPLRAPRSALAAVRAQRKRMVAAPRTVPVASPPSPEADRRERYWGGRAGPARR